jgi:phosphoglycerate dehydrogenase-like enzyme
VTTATRKGVMVVNAPQSNVLSAAEHTVALLLALARNIPQAHAALVAGRLIRTLFAGVATPGEHRVTWDGRTTSGERAAPGVYFARLEDGERGQVVRMVHVR